MAYTTIDDPSAHFQVTLYTGDGNDDRQVTNDGNSDLQPDWVWLKDRTQAEAHALFDSTRGATKRIQSSNANAESTEAATLKSFTSDGFTLGTSASINNGSNPDTYVAWCWKANGGTTSSNSSGSITSTVQANTDAGFSIVTFTGTGSAATVGHGLGVAPAVIIAKNRDSSANWVMRHQNTANNYDFLGINTTSAVTANDSVWTQTDPTTSVFSIGTASAINQSTQKIVAYCFAEKQGYSKFGKYKGNGSADGTFVYTGFKPAWIMMKNTGVVTNWRNLDSERLGYNKDNNRLSSNTTAAEQTDDQLDILSNGFKLRTTDSEINSGYTFVYMAFAENPFVTSTGIPTTAR
jgi:hypothetical protein